MSNDQVSEHEPYDLEWAIDKMSGWCGATEQEFACSVEESRAFYDDARRAEEIIRAEHALRLEAEARAERLERERRDFVFTVNRWFKNHAGCDCEACWSYSASVVAESVAVAALETGGEG